MWVWLQRLIFGILEFCIGSEEGRGGGGRERVIGDGIYMIGFYFTLNVKTIFLRADT